MFFKKIIIIFFICVFSFTSFSQDKFFTELSCSKEIKQYYPGFLKGQLELKKQKRFFHCIWGFLDLGLNKGFLEYNPEQGPFTKTEIFRMFHRYFKYDTEDSEKLTLKLFAIKKLLIGGSIDELKYEELRKLLNLVYDYEVIYFILHRQIPVFRKMFKNKAISSKERDSLLEQLRKALKLLKEAYQRESIDYTIEDISRYGDYLKQANLIETENKEAFWFLQNLLEGIIFPKKEVQSKDWSPILTSLHRTISLLLYQRVYLEKEQSLLVFTYYSMEALNLFLSLLESNQELVSQRGFPLKNLDEMLSVLVSVWDKQSSVPAFFSQLKDKKIVNFMTRVLTCFSLNDSTEKKCKSEWEKDSSVVSFSFPDSQFQIFKDNIVKEDVIDFETMFIDSNKLNTIKDWAKDYQNSLRNIYHGNIETVAVQRQFDHWLDPFFGWSEDRRVIFGEFHQTNNEAKVFQFLHYQAFLNLIFYSYVPESYFSTSGEGLSFKTWKSVISDLSPALSVLGGSRGYDSSWRESFYNLFQVADTFLNSSNQDETMNSKELVDLSIHLLESMKSAQTAFETVNNSCEEGDLNNCASQTLLENPVLLSVVPRFRDYIFEFERNAYKEKMQKTLGDLEQGLSSFDFMPLFFLMQLMELNYNKIDRNRSFNLESEELLLFAERFKDQINRQIPFIFNSEQALAYLMYSFKTGYMPFFTGSDFEPVKFTHWYLHPKTQRPYRMIPNDFHYLMFDFYNLYKK